MAKLDLEACRALGRAAADAQASLAAHQRLLEALHPADPVRARRALQAKGLAAGHYAQTPDHGAMRVIDLSRLDPGMQATAAALGLSVPLLSLIAKDMVGYAGPDPVDHVISPEEHAFTERLYRVTKMYVRRFYQHPFIQARGMVTLDPFTGERLVSTHSFPADALHVLFRFEGLETFYLGIGAINGAIRFLGIPRLNCIVAMPSYGEDEGHVRWGIGVYRRTMARMLARAPEMETIFRTPRTKVGVLVGFWPNFAHYLWQDISGLQEILDVHGAEAISHVLVGPHSDFNIPEVFPELAGVPMQHIEKPAEVFEETFHSDTQYLRPIGMLIQPALRERLARAAEKHAPPALQARIADVAQRRFLVWVTLRKNKKVWLRQVEGHVAVLRRLARDVGPMAVVIDGWSNTQEEAEALRAALEPEIETISILGCGVYESFLWARAAHVYSNIVGSGLFMNTYFACRPGVAHSNPRHLDQAVYWAAQSPGSCEPVFFTRAETQGDNDLMADYDFDPELLYLKLRGVVRQHYPGRLRNPEDTCDVLHSRFGLVPSAEGAPVQFTLSRGPLLRHLRESRLLQDEEPLDPGGPQARAKPFFAQMPDPTLAPHGRIMTDPASLTYEAAPILAGAIKDAVVLPPGGLVLMGQEVLGDTFYGSPLDGPPERSGKAEALREIGQQLTTGIDRVPGQGFCGAIPNLQYPGHWMVGGLPRLVAFARLQARHKDMKLILPPLPPGSLATQALAMLRIETDAIHTLAEQRPVAFETTWAMPELSLWGVSPVTRQAAQHLAETVPHHPHEGVGERVFLKPPPGQLANESELTDVLDRHGFVTVDVESLNLVGRIRMFRRARHVVGLHGSALAGTLFCHEGAALLELFGPTSPGPMYWTIASRSGMRYGYMVGEPSATSADPKQGLPFRIAQAQLALALEAMLTAR